MTGRAELPNYDTISLAPPAFETAQASSSRQQPSDSAANETERPARKSLKEQWKELKQEDSRRKPNSEKYETVSAEEADRITGLDKHKGLEAKKSAERKRGGKSILGMLMMT